MTGKLMKTMDHASPTMSDVTSEISDDDLIKVTDAHVTKMRKHPDWAKETELQEAANRWAAQADAVKAQAAVISSLLADVGAARAHQVTLHRNWYGGSRRLLAVGHVVCNGSKEAIASWSFDARGQATSSLRVAPELTRLETNVSGEAAVEWDREPRGCVVQHASDTLDEKTFSAAIPCRRSKYVVDGLRPQSTHYFRIAMMDDDRPTGYGDFGPWLAITVS